MKYISFILFMLIFPIVLSAQEHPDKEKIEVSIGILGSGEEGSNFCGNLTYRYYVSGRFAVGGGLGYDLFGYPVDGGTGSLGKNSAISLYANLQFLSPISLKTNFIVELNGGSICGFSKHRDFDFSGLLSPQAGFSFKLKNTTSLNIKAAYKKITATKANYWGGVLGFSF